MLQVGRGKGVVDNCVYASVFHKVAHGLYIHDAHQRISGRLDPQHLYVGRQSLRNVVEVSHVDEVKQQTERSEYLFEQSECAAVHVIASDHAVTGTQPFHDRVHSCDT